MKKVDYQVEGLTSRTLCRCPVRPFRTQRSLHNLVKETFYSPFHLDYSMTVGETTLSVWTPISTGTSILVVTEVYLRTGTTE